MEKLKYLLRFWIAGICTLLLLSCNDNPSSSKDENYELEIKALSDILSKRINFFPGLSLDSLNISQDTLFVHVTDSYAEYANPVLYNQNFKLIFQDFVHIDSAPFLGIKAKYRLVKRDSLDFFTLYSGNLEALQASLHIFINPPFTQLVNSIVSIHKEYPKIGIIDRLNSAFANRLRDPEIENDLFFGEDFLEVAATYLVECEEKRPGRFRKIVLETMEEMREDLEDEIVDVLLESFSKNCILLQELNPEKSLQKKKEITL